MKRTLSAEAAARVEKIVGRIRVGQSPQQIRDRRLVAVLEFMADPRAAALLKEYAEGDERFTRAREARSALARRTAK